MLSSLCVIGTHKKVGLPPATRAVTYVLNGSLLTNNGTPPTFTFSTTSANVVTPISNLVVGTQYYIKISSSCLYWLRYNTAGETILYDSTGNTLIIASYAFTNPAYIYIYTFSGAVNGTTLRVYGGNSSNTAKDPNMVNNWMSFSFASI